MPQLASSVWGLWTCIFPGKHGICWKRAWDAEGAEEEAKAQAAKNCNVVAVPLQLWESIDKYQRGWVEKEKEIAKLKTALPKKEQPQDEGKVVDLALSRLRPATADERAGWYLCSLCFPGGYEFGRIGDAYSLVLIDGKLQVLGGQGHRGGELFTFPVLPWKDPDDGSDEPTPAVAEAMARWMADWKLLEKTLDDLHLDVQSAYCFGHACTQAGWNMPVLACWLMDFCADLIEKAKIEEAS